MNDITVYTTNTCPNCTMLKNFLEDKGIAYKEVNVQEDPIAAQRLVNATVQMGVPQSNINGNWVLGFDSNSIMSFLKKSLRIPVKLGSLFILSCMVY